MKAVFKHEAGLYSHGLLAYVFGAFLLEFIGIGAMLYKPFIRILVLKCL